MSKRKAMRTISASATTSAWSSLSDRLLNCHLSFRNIVKYPSAPLTNRMKSLFLDVATLETALEWCHLMRLLSLATNLTRDSLPALIIQVNLLHCQSICLQSHHHRDANDLSPSFAGIAMPTWNGLENGGLERLPRRVVRKGVEEGEGQ